jgi:hypothetical protein
MFNLFESMFFHERSTQAEYFDAPGLSEAERARGIPRIGPHQSSLPLQSSVRQPPAVVAREKALRTSGNPRRWRGHRFARQRMSAWAQRRGWDWRFTNLDANPVLKSVGPAKTVTGSALQLPFADGSFDLVVASQMTHHSDGRTSRPRIGAKRGA